MFDFIYTIPTHRPIGEEFVNGFFKEVDYANKTLKKNGALVVFEDNNEPINKNVLTKYKQIYPDVQLFYIEKQRVFKFYDKIKNKLSDNDQKVFEKLYPNKNVNYGNVFNRIFLFAQLFKAKVIIRRDSDCLIDNNGEFDVFPIKIELDRIGKQIEDKTVYIVGGGYKGKYNLDIDDLIKDGNDYTLVKELFTCMSIPAEHHDDIIEEEILGNNVDFVEDFIDNDSRAYPECGNVSLYKLHEYLPAPSQDFILGSDYFFIDVAVHTKLNVTYHNRAVIHKHTSDRSASKEKVRNYWYGLMQLIDSQIFYRHFYDSYLEKVNFNTYSKTQQVDYIVQNMQKAYQEFVQKFDDYREEKLSSLLNLLQKTTRPEIKNSILELTQTKTQIYNITNVSILEHIKLIETWQRVSNVISQISVNYVSEVINKSKIEL